MTNREIVLCIDGAVGSITCLYLGYKLHQLVERWVARRAARRAERERVEAEWHRKRVQGHDRLARRFDVEPKQNLRDALAKPRVIPLVPRRHVVYMDVAGDPSKVDPIPLPVTPGGSSRVDSDEATKMVTEWRDAWPDVARVTDNLKATNETARQIREDALAALTSAGYKRAAAEAALDACTLVERGGGLESWVAAALRRAAMKP